MIQQDTALSNSVLLQVTDTTTFTDEMKRGRGGQLAVRNLHALPAAHGGRVRAVLYHRLPLAATNPGLAGQFHQVLMQRTLLLAARVIHGFHVQLGDWGSGGIVTIGHVVFKHVWSYARPWMQMLHVKLQRRSSLTSSAA